MTPKQKYNAIRKLQRECQRTVETYEADNPIDADMVRSIQAQFFWDVTAILERGKTHVKDIESV
jgi:hypothetical protein